MCEGACSRACSVCLRPSTEEEEEEEDDVTSEYTDSIEEEEEKETARTLTNMQVLW